MSITQYATTQDTFLDILLGLTKFEVTNLVRTDEQICITGNIVTHSRCDHADAHEDMHDDVDKDMGVLCPKCHSRAHINGYTMVNIKHSPFGCTPVILRVMRKRYYCPRCHHNFQENIPFKSQCHFITRQLQCWIEDLLSMNILTISGIAKLTHVHGNIVKTIDKHRLRQRYHTGRNKFGKVICCYKKSTHYSRFLGIDEFSLHKHHKYATVIMDLETGEILYVAHGKQKQVVKNFIKLFGDDFMQHVVAVASDMNAGYQSAFKEAYSHIESIYDHFHLVKTLNDELIKPIRKEEYERLSKEKNPDAELLKKSKYLLLTNYSNLDSKKKATLEQILDSNQLLFTADIIKEQLQYAYTLDNALDMTEVIYTIIQLCTETDNPHFLKFARLLQNHLDGIVMHAIYSISTGRVEGTNNKIKTIRRQAYGFRDDEYFFLKILDFTSKSHRKM